MLLELQNIILEMIARGALQPSIGSVERAVVVADIEMDARWQEFKHLALPLGFKSCWSTPIAKNLGIRVVAEGIEALSQAEQLLGMGCLLGQGYLYIPEPSIERLQLRSLSNSVNRRCPEAKQEILIRISTCWKEFTSLWNRAKLVSPLLNP